MKRKVLTLAAMVAALAVSSVMAADVSYTSVLSGKVDSVVPVGTTVAEGDVLLTVESLAGPMPAARANSNSSGTVKSVTIQPGSAVTQGTVVVVVETK
ncbi:biotin/lipoyl-containing protein [uncultured Megasphaera sp.]|uniref:biotin/lipoyl-containing protein n=1 Tax=uncultured Megasphaera sp. TaxID=165188 RepID=UPI0025841FE8|nr:biotin/lipoyl-containing protein [uncultured Megasphaera sp.]